MTSQPEEWEPEPQTAKPEPYDFSQLAPSGPLMKRLRAKCH